MRKIAHRKLREILKQYFFQSQKKNPLFSLRALAIKLGVSVTTLSQYMNGKRIISAPLVKRILSLLPVTEGVEKEIMKDLSFSKAADESLSNQSDWCWTHVIVLCLLDTPIKKFPLNELENTIALKIGSSELSVKKILADLEKEKFISTEEGYVRILKPEGNFERKGDKRIRQINKEIIEEVLKKTNLLHQPEVYHKTNFSSITMAGSPRKFNLIAQKIEQFQYEIAEFVDDGENNEEVYTLSMQFFEV